MKKIHRKIFFWFFFGLFLTTTPLAVFYSQGYRFDFSGKIFVHSGSITVKSVPSGVNVFVNDISQKTSSLDIINNSVTVNGLRPGNYKLRLSADGYRDWEKNVEVHSGISTEFWNVFLVPSDIPAKKVDSSVGTKRYFVSPFNEKIAYVKENGGSMEIWFSDPAKNENMRLYESKDVFFSGDEFENAEWNTKEKLILNPVFKNEKKDFLILDSEQSAEPAFLSKIISSKNPAKARWSPKEEKGIYFSTKPEKNGEQGNLYFIDSASGEEKLIAEKIEAFDISSNRLYTLKENGVLYKTDLEGNGEEQVAASAFSSSGAGDSRLIIYDDNRQALITGEGDLTVRNKGKEEFMEKIAGGIKGIQFSDDGKKLLFWSGNEISVMFLRDWDVQPQRVEGEIQQIIRFSSPVKNVFWYRDYEHIFFTNAGKVKIAELDSRDRRLCFDVLRYDSEFFLSSYDSYNGTFYYLDGKQGEENIFYFDIPEKTGFFAN